MPYALPSGKCNESFEYKRFTAGLEDARVQQ